MVPLLVSVVIPTFNYGHFICEAVQSVLAQTYPYVEVIVVDDGSTDNTKDQLSQYCDRIRYVYQENAGLSAARNVGLSLAKGEFLALLDSDDAFHPRKLEFQVACMNANPELGLLGTRQFRGDAWPDIGTPILHRLTLRDAVLRTQFVPSSALLRRSVFDAIGGFDERVSAVADRDYWIRAAAISQTGVLEVPLTFYRVHEHSMTVTRTHTMIEHEMSVLEKAFEMPVLREQRLLRRRALGLACTAAASGLVFDAKLPWAAAVQLVASIVHWPFFFGLGDTPRSHYRLFLFKAILLRVWRSFFEAQGAVR